MSKIISLAIMVSMLILPACVLAEETQQIENDNSDFSVNLNSQIKEDGQVKKQGIKNVNSKFNVNINRNTYKFYYFDNNKTNKTNIKDGI